MSALVKTSQASQTSPAPGGLGGWYSSLDPSMQRTLLGGILGAGAGATALGLSHALRPKDEESKRGWKSQALLGALMGGTAGAALPYGLSMLRGQVRLPEEPTTGPTEDAFTDVAKYLAYEQPGAAIGGTYGTYRNWDALKPKKPASGAPPPPPPPPPPPGAHPPPGAGTSRVLRNLRGNAKAKALLAILGWTAGGAVAQRVLGN